MHRCNFIVFLLFFHDSFPPRNFPIFVFFCIFTPPFSNLGDRTEFPDGTIFYPDSQDGKYGFNTDPNRGADTFHPFKSAGKLTISELRFRQLQPGDWSWFTLNTENYNNLDIQHARCDNLRAHLYINGTEYGMPVSNLHVDISTVNSVQIYVDAPTNADVTYITNIVLSE